MIEPKNEFEKAIIMFFRDVADMVILKNRMYGDSYRKLRITARNDLNNPKIPVWLHVTEKLNRYITQDSDVEDPEDPLRDGAGYLGLEAVCRIFDDLRSSNED